MAKVNGKNKVKKVRKWVIIYWLMFQIIIYEQSFDVKILQVVQSYSFLLCEENAVCIL